MEEAVEFAQGLRGMLDGDGDDGEAGKDKLPIWQGQGPGDGGGPGRETFPPLPLRGMAEELLPLPSPTPPPYYPALPEEEMEEAAELELALGLLPSLAKRSLLQTSTGQLVSGLSLAFTLITIINVQFSKLIKSKCHICYIFNLIKGDIANFSNLSPDTNRLWPPIWPGPAPPQPRPQSTSAQAQQLLYRTLQVSLLSL